MTSARFVAALLLAVVGFAAIASAQAVPSDPVLVHWPAPLLWSFTEKPVKEAPDATEPGGEPLSVAGAVPTSPLPFVGIAPCRLADTRGNGFTGQYGPPQITPAGRTITIVGQCGIPANAQAVSFNFHAVNVTAAGFLVAYPAGEAFPPVAIMAYNQNTPAISNSSVVPLGTGGAITVVAGVTNIDLVIDTNGYYGPNLDTVYVNEGQVSSVTSAMIMDGEIVNADINASAAIADTKLATISTAGKVADSALSANVTKLGPTIEAGEITDLTRSVNIPLTSFIDCQTDGGAFLDFSSGADPIANFFAPPADGSGVILDFDATVGSEDQNSEVCAHFVVPPDYASGGTFRFAGALVLTPTGSDEVLNCSAGRNFNAHEAAGTVAITGALDFLTCTPTLTGLAGGDNVDFFFMITSSGTMDNAVRLFSLEFRYTATQ